MNEKWWAVLHWLGFHKWTNWSEPEKSELRLFGLNLQIVQDRRCEICNYCEIRKMQL